MLGVAKTATGQNRRLVLSCQCIRSDLTRSEVAPCGMPMETCPYPKLTTKMRISAIQARKQTQKWICFRAFLRPHTQEHTVAVRRLVRRKINRLSCKVGSGRHRYIRWSRGIFPGRAEQEKEIFIMKHHNDHLTVTSGPESNPAGAALGRAAATFHPHPVPLPGTDHRTPAAQSAPRPRVRVRRGRPSPTRFQRGAGDHTQLQKTTETGFRFLPCLPRKT